MEDQQRFAQIADVRRKFLFGNVIEQGAAIVTTARASAMRGAAASTAAPPRLCPIRIVGAASVRRR
jgi:hypothetical protein